jgi:hypothetical protein
MKRSQLGFSVLAFVTVFSLFGCNNISTSNQIASNGKSSSVTTGGTGKTISSHISQFMITFQNWNGELLQKDAFASGTMPVFYGTVPTKPGDVQYKYVFSGWSPSVVPAVADATYTAQFTTTVNSYTVTWENWDGTVLETDQSVEYGTTPTYDGTVPTRPGDSQYSYTFSGWSPSVTKVTGDSVYVASFNKIAATKSDIAAYYSKQIKGPLSNVLGVAIGYYDYPTVGGGPVFETSQTIDFINSPKFVYIDQDFYFIQELNVSNVTSTPQGKIYFYDAFNTKQGSSYSFTVSQYDGKCCVVANIGIVLDQYEKFIKYSYGGYYNTLARLQATV